MIDRIPITVFLLLLAVTIFCRGQDSTQAYPHSSSHAIGVTIGVNQVKEENLLPRVHSGFITTLSYEYLRIQELYQDFRFAIGYSRIIAEPEDITKSANLMLTASYSHAFTFAENQRFTYYLGPQARIAYSVSLYPNWDESHLYWANSASIGITNIMTYRFDPTTQLLSTLSIPLLSLYNRPDPLRLYKIDEISAGGITRSLHRNLKAGLFSTLFFVHFDVEYQFPVFQTKTEAVFYSLDYTRFAQGDAPPFAQLIHQFGVRILL
jgi:hypothetical protein